MIQILLISLVVLAVIAIALLVIVMSRGSGRTIPQLEDRLASIGAASEKGAQWVKDELALARDESALNARHGREEIANSFKLFSDVIKGQLDTFADQLAKLTGVNEQKLDAVRLTVEEKIGEIRNNNEKGLALIREAVDEKLSSTLEKRLGESFKLVSERLELVHKGLGEMQSLATGVGDLKRVLTNIKTRGTWGEIQLGALLEQVLTTDQYAKNIATRSGSNERVEFALKLPGRELDGKDAVWLPIDSKFPKEDYERLMEAQEQGNPRLADESARQLEATIKLEARKIKEKYIAPPDTVDFGIMFLPFESLYAEVLRRPGLSDLLQREHRIVVAGPSTLAAFLNSLQMGFRTLAIEKRTSEVWSVLSAVKTEFGKFGAVLEKTQKKLQEASNTIESATVRSRVIERKLRNVQELPLTADNSPDELEKGVVDSDNETETES